MSGSGWDTDAGGMAAFLIPGVVVPFVLLVLALLQPTKRQVRRWGAVCDVAITDANEEQVRTHLARGRRFRSLAAFPFWWLMGIRAIHADFPAALASPVPGIAAYVGGALLAEVTSAPATSTEAVRRATLLPRSIDDYTPNWTRLLPWILIAVGAVATALGRHVDSITSTAHGVTVVLLAIAFAGFAELVSRYLVRRPQRGGDPDVLAADDGLRAVGVSTAQAAAGLAGLAAASAGLDAGVPTVTGAWGFLLVPFIFADLGLTVGLLCCIVRQETWGYRRRQRHQIPVAVPA